MGVCNKTPYLLLLASYTYLFDVTLQNPVLIIKKDLNVKPIIASESKINNALQNDLKTSHPLSSPIRMHDPDSILDIHTIRALAAGRKYPIEESYFYKTSKNKRRQSNVATTIKNVGVENEHNYKFDFDGSMIRHQGTDLNPSHYGLKSVQHSHK